MPWMNYEMMVAPIQVNLRKIWDRAEVSGSRNPEDAHQHSPDPFAYTGSHPQGRAFLSFITQRSFCIHIIIKLPVFRT